MNQRDIDAMMKSIAPIISGFVLKAIEPLTARIKELEEREPPKDGKDGMDGKAGADGSRGADGVDGLAGKDGVDGVNGKDGMDGAAGKDGVDGAAGRDGVDGKDGSIGLNGKDGADGRDGRDASDLNVIAGIVREQIVKELHTVLSTVAASTDDEGRTVVLQFTYGDVVVKTQIHLGVVLDRGVWKECEYEKGDGVTSGGSFFIAQRSTAINDKPGQSDAWRLAVKRGRDGAEGKVKDTAPRIVKSNGQSKPQEEK